MKTQRGISLIELLSVAAIIAILGAVALPHFQDFRLQQTLNSGEYDVMQGLQQARQMARSQGVFVTAEFGENELLLRPSNNPQNVERIPLPDNLVFANTTDFTFTPNGTLGLPNGGNGIELAGLSFDISPRNSQSGVMPRSIQVTSFGSIAGL